MLHLTGSQAFRPYFADANPIVVTSLVASVAVASLAYLDAGGWLFVDRPLRGRRRFVLPMVLATALPIPVVLVDLAGGFPEDINVLPPESLLFYPVIAVVAEVLFHVMPVAVLIVVVTRALRTVSPDTVVVLCLILVSLPEPVLQVTWGLGESPGWVNAYVAFHLLLFNLLAVYLFLRNGFLSMLAFRLTYYLWWHVAWGVLRLRLLS